jgi:hypothetical protein
VRVLRRGAKGELVQVRLADVDVACGFEPADCLGGARGKVLGEQDRAVGRDEPGGVEEVLDGERDALARTLRSREEDPLGGAQSTAR